MPALFIFSVSKLIKQKKEIEQKNLNKIGGKKEPWEEKGRK